MNNDSSTKKHFFWNFSFSFDGFTTLASNNNEFKVTLIVSLLIKGDHSPFSSNRSVVLCIKGVFKNIIFLWGWVSNTSTSSLSVNCSILRTVKRNNIHLQLILGHSREFCNFSLKFYKIQTRKPTLECLFYQNFISIADKR